MKYLLNFIAAGFLIYLLSVFAGNVYNAKKAAKEARSGAVSKANKIIVRPEDGNGIQKAVDIASPGDTIELLPGEYYQDVVTKKDGLKDQPITIRGPKTAVIKGAGKPRIFEINHSYITLDGFTVDGHFKEADEKSSYRDKLIYIIGIIPEKVMTNIKIVNLDLKNAGGECVRLRYLIQNSEIAYNSILACGISDFEFNDGGKNGEGVYIGTAPEQLKDGKNPTAKIDRSNNNWVHHNQFNTQGNECVDIKEGSSFNLIENNRCTGQKDINSGGMDSRGNDNIFRYNEIYDNLGAGVRLGGDNKKDGINNQVYGNKIINNQSGGISFQRMPQGQICGNEMQDNAKGNSVGSYGQDFHPEESC